MAPESTFTFHASEQQKRIWGLQESGGLYAQACLALPRGLGASALVQAASRVVGRHEILRTTFHRRAGVRFPYQVVGGSGEPRWREARTTGDRLEEVLREERSEPWDLGTGPMVRLALLQGAGPEPLLVVTLPVLCADPRTLELLVEELLGFATGGPAWQAAAEEPLQYVDFTRWQEETLAGEDADLAPPREHWRRLPLEGLAGLSLAGGRAAAGAFDPGFFRCVAELGWTPQLAELAGQVDAGLPAFALAAWMTFLWRMGAADGLVIGRLAAARTLEELESCLGPIARVVPLAVPLANGLAFVDLWRAVEHEVRAGDRWAELAPQPRAWPFQFEAHEPCAGDGRWLRWHGEPFELKLVVSCARGRLSADLWYDRRLYEPAAAGDLAERFAVLLRGALRDPGGRLGALDLLTEEEYRRLVLESNRSAPSVALTRCVHELFAEQAAQHPDRVAVVSEEGHLTAGELEDRANRLSHYLRRTGLGPEGRVAIFLERSCESIVAILGILKAGGAYVPLDPVFPRERIAGMLEEAQVAAVLTRRRWLDALPDHPARRICLDADAHLIAQESPRAPASGVGLENLIYVLFTSGSTGRPKGVATEHRHLLCYLAGILERLALRAGRTFATVSTLAADLGHTAIFPALVCGGTLHVVPAEQASDPAALADCFRRHPVDVLKIVPSHLSAVLQRPAEVLPHELLVLGGEAGSRELIEQVRAAAPELRICNHYGPTETTVGVATWEVPEPLPAEVSRLPLGRPLPGARIYLLNPELQPVPPGVAGEVYIGGGGVARGYLDAPEQTAQRFLPSPFDRQAGQRLYRTGDLARFQPGGDLEFLGRADGQVKIRGFRIELGEIEAVLHRHPDVRECAVTARESGGEAQIVAYVVPRRERQIVAAGLRSHLAERLPSYMLPAAFVRLEALPLTPNGKVDRRALPPPGEGRGAVRGPGARPRDLLELELVKIWEDLLHLSPIATDESFFEIGGHSLLAVQMMAQIEKRLGCPLPLATLYRSPTIGGLAQLLGSEARLGEPSPLVSIQPHGRRPPFFCVHPIGGEVLCFYHLSRALGPDQPFYGLQASGLKPPPRGALSISDMAAQYLAAIREVAPDGPYLVGGYSFGCTVALEMAHQLRRAGEQVPLLALIDGGAPGSAAEVDGVEDDAIAVAQWLRQQAREDGAELSLSFAEIRRRLPDARLPYVLEQAKLQGRLPAEVDLALVHRRLAEVRLRLRAAAAYLPDPTPDPIVYFRSTERDPDYLEVLRELGYEVAEPTQGWARFALQPIEVHDIPGLHEMLMLPPNVERLAEILRAAIDRGWPA
jgi:amino acid adenylation domain-containing protein